MCPYCEGRVEMSATNCTYCGSFFEECVPEYTQSEYEPIDEPPTEPTYQEAQYVHQEIGQEAIHQSETQSESVTSHYQPPYNPTFDDPLEQKEITKTIRKKKPKAEAKKEEKSSIFALLFLSIGGYLFTIAWALFFFSNKGKLTLELSSNYWPLYLLLSAPLFYQGWKKLLRTPT